MRLAWRVLAWLGVASLLLPLAAYFALRALLMPLPGEWTTDVRIGPLEFRAGVPSLVRLATSHWVAPRLDGLSWPTRAGVLQFQWLDESDALAVRCAPCTLRVRGLGDAPLRLPEVNLTVQRDFSDLQGLVEAGAVRGSWQGRLTPERLRVALDIPSTPVADGYALFAANIPELARARIDGRFSLKAEVTLPNGELRMTPRMEGFAVSGLGTGELASAQSACGPAPRGERLSVDGWLARAVIAAEDQRFWEHTGYDLREIDAAFTANQSSRLAEQALRNVRSVDGGAPGADLRTGLRGGSTLPQQLAKLLVTGDERSPARKLRELLYAADMEQSLGKSRILHLYMENAPWGPGICGAHAAARHYFGRSVKQLTPAQAVWLAAMLHNPAVEAQRWAGRGQIDLVRARWVAQGVRGITRRERIALAEDMRQAPLWIIPVRH